MVHSFQMNKALALAVVLYWPAAIWASDPAESYAQLQDQQNQLRGKPDEHAILIKMSDLLWDPASWGHVGLTADEDEPDLGIRLLDQIISGEMYSPYLADAWLKWRHRTQLYWHGASNQSEIPNDLYNARRNGLIRIIGQYLEDHPRDSIAGEQLRVLKNAKNIVPLPVGNSAVLEWELSTADPDRL